MLKKLWQVIKKEIKLIIRARASSLIMIFGPLVLIVLIGLAFSGSGLTGIKIGIYSEAGPEATNYIYSKLNSSKTLAKEAESQFTLYRTASKESCIEAVEDGKYHLCIHILQKQSNQTIVNLYADFSQMDLAWAIIRTITTKVDETSNAISYNISSSLLTGLRDASIGISENAYLLDSMSEEGTNMQVKLESIKADMSSFSLDSNISTQDVDTYLQMVQENKQKLDTLGQSTQTASQLSDEKIQQIKNILDGVDSIIEEVRQNLVDFSNEAEAKVEELKTVQSQLEQKVLSPEYQEQAAPEENEAMLNSIYLIEQQIEATQTTIDQVEIVLQQQTPIEKTISDVSVKVDETSLAVKAKIKEVENMRTSALNDLNKVQAKLKESKTKLNETLGRIEEAKKMQKELDKNFADINQSLSNSLGNLDQFSNQSKQFSSQLYQISSIDPETMINPVYVRVRPLSAVSSKIAYLFPSFIALIIMFVSVMLASTIIITEKKSPAGFRNFITPNKDALFILGAFISALLIVLFQAAILVVVGVFAFNIKITNPAILILAIVATASVFICIGLIVGYVFKTAETGTMFSISAVLLMMSYSPLFMPLEVMPKFASFASQFNPFTVSSKIMRLLLIKAQGFSSVKVELLILAVTLAILAIIVFRSEKVSKSRIT